MRTSRASSRSGRPPGQALRRSRGEVLEGVDGQVHLAVEESAIQFPGEEPLPPISERGRSWSSSPTVRM
jgi:hypothetical protein